MADCGEWADIVVKKTRLQQKTVFHISCQIHCPLGDKNAILD